MCPQCGHVLPEYPDTDQILAERGLTRATAARGMCICSLLDQEQQRKDRARWADADLPRGPVPKTFDNYDVYTEGLKEAFAAAQALVERSPPNILLLTSAVSGTGKSHLLEAIGRAELRAGNTVKYAYVPDLLDHLRSTYSPSSEEDLWELLHGCRKVDTLLLDDLGQGNNSEWVQEKILALVDERYRNGRRLAIASNLTAMELEREMGQRMASRLYDTTSGTVLVVHLKAVDYRVGE